MDRTLRIGIVVEAVVLVAALALSTVYFSQGLYKTSGPLDAVLIIVWILVAAILLFVLWWRSAVRAETVRRLFIGKDGAYNYELGFTPIEEAAPNGTVSELVSFAADKLDSLAYTYQVVDVPEEFEPYLLVSSSSFTAHRVDGKTVVDRWKGSVQRIGISESGTHTYVDMGSFSSEDDLSALIREVAPLS